MQQRLMQTDRNIRLRLVVRPEESAGEKEGEKVKKERKRWTGEERRRRRRQRS